MWWETSGNGVTTGILRIRRKTKPIPKALLEVYAKFFGEEASGTTHTGCDHPSGATLALRTAHLVLAFGL
jgi:hypothetical protein